VPYDGKLTLPDGDLYFSRYTSSGVRVEAETSDGSGELTRYKSVFMGWSLEAGRTLYTPRWKVNDDITMADLAAELGIAGQDSATVTLYAIWDDCPWIVSQDLYYTLMSAQSGKITEAEILSHATASDREDGSPIAAGHHENGTEFYIADYQMSDFMQFEHSGSVTENLTVTDSVGSTYKKQITVYIVDTEPKVTESDKTSRFIDEKYYSADEDAGGLKEESIWKTNAEYVSELESALYNEEHDRPTETYYFDHEKILSMRRYIETNGMFDAHSQDIMYDFYMKFIAEAF
jgi:hypothetical protein